MEEKGTFSYRTLKAYKEAKTYAHEINELLKSFPSEERFAMTDQLRRSSTSVMYNIAEGCGRFSIKEQVHFVEIAFGSLLESMSQLELAQDYNYITEGQLGLIEQRVELIAKLLSGYRKSLLNKL